uniref:Uncharacterized protein n=1 Tax=Calidris pygmaea TaxID=425635 RepID=A0A8C3JH05_9CHAR
SLSFCISVVNVPISRQGCLALFIISIAKCLWFFKKEAGFVSTCPFSFQNARQLESVFCICFSLWHLHKGGVKKLEF